jgi:general secretion pathway protein L
MKSPTSWLRGSVVMQLSDLVSRLGHWWLREFLALLPEKAAQWLMGADEIALWLAHDEAFVQFRLCIKGKELDVVRMAAGEYTAAAIDDLLTRHQLRRSDVTIGIALRPEQIFPRRLVLPLEAAGNVEEIVARELADRTPFRLADIHYDYVITRETGKIIVRQRLVKRDSVEAAAQTLGLDVSEIGILEASAQRGEPAEDLTVRLRRDRSDRTFWVRRAAIGLAGAAAVLVLTACVTDYWRQQSALDELELQIAKVRREAQEVRDAFAKLEHGQSGFRHLLARKNQAPALLSIWDEVTRLVPSDSWLTELHLTSSVSSQDYHVAVSGFSPAAAKLVVIFDASPKFREAALTTAVALDPVEQRERFALQAAIRRSMTGSTIP